MERPHEIAASRFRAPSRDSRETVIASEATQSRAGGAAESHHPWLRLVPIGLGISVVPLDTSVNIAKLIIDYGLVGIAAFLGMFLGTLWRREYAILSVLALMTFVVGGGYLLFTPMLVLLMLLCIWSGLPADRVKSAE